MSKSTTTTTTYHSNDDAIAEIVNAPNSFWRMNEHIVSGARYFTADERDEFIANGAVLSITSVVFEPNHVYNGKEQPRWVVTAGVNDDMGRISFTDNEHRGTILRLMADYLDGHPGAFIPAVIKELPPQQRGHQPYRYLWHPDTFVPTTDNGNSAN